MKTNIPSIREYAPNDKSALLQLLDLNTPTYFAPAERTDFESYLDHEVELYYVVTFENRIVGCGGINFETDKSIGIISWDIIHPDYQGKALGSLLLQHRLSALKTLDTMPKIIVRTSHLTHLFYQKHGFVLKDKIVDYWAPGFDLYFMEHQEL